MAHRNAASVLPEPVGAITSAFSPRAMASHARACTAVGAPNVSANHVRTGSENDAIASNHGRLAQCSGEPRARGLGEHPERGRFLSRSHKSPASSKGARAAFSTSLRAASCW